METAPAHAESAAYIINAAENLTPKWKSPQEIKEIMDAINMQTVQAHFSQGDNAGSQAKGDNDDDGLHDGCEPFLVAEGISEDEFNQYYDACGDGEAPIALRFLELSEDGSLWIVELPSKVHEVSHKTFHAEFYDAWGLAGARMKESLTFMVSTTVDQKEAGEAYGPRPNPNVPRPQALGNEEWITVVVKVGMSQKWESLEAKAVRWYAHPGIQYVLLIQIGREARRLKYALYDVPANLGAQPPARPGPPAFSGIVWFAPIGGGAPAVISLHNRRLMGFMPGQPLPPNVAVNSNVDMLIVLNEINAHL